MTISRTHDKPDVELVETRPASPGLRPNPVLLHVRRYRADMSDATTGLPEPWFVPDEQTRERLTHELLTELSEGHPLFDIRPEVLNRCSACDEVLVRVGEGKFGMVHLTWTGQRETPPWPRYSDTGGYVATELAQLVHGRDHGFPEG
jgi:hypothetical protein